MWTKRDLKSTLFAFIGEFKKPQLHLCSFSPYLIRILQTLCRKLKLPDSFEFHHLARLTPGYVGADLMALCREAAMCTVNRVLIKSEKQKRKHIHAGGNTAEESTGIGTDVLVEEDTKQLELPPKVLSKLWSM